MVEEMRYGYARVSSEEQNLARQRSQLSAAGCDQLVEEVQSGVKARHRLDRLLAGLDAGDELVVTELDRLGRSTGEAVLLMDDLIRRGVVLRVLALPSLDITTNDGRLIADILASLAAHERRRTRERQRQGIVAAKAAGRRPPSRSAAKAEWPADRRGARQTRWRRGGARGRARLWGDAQDAQGAAGAPRR